MVPLLPLRKGPEQKGWQHQRLSVAELRGWARRFTFDLPARSPNLGVLLGEPSGGLVDVDCDCAEARAAAALLLPPTDRISERTSSLASHYWYVVTDDAPQTAKFAWTGDLTPDPSPCAERGAASEDDATEPGAEKGAATQDDAMEREAVHRDDAERGHRPNERDECHRRRPPADVLPVAGVLRIQPVGHPNLTTDLRYNAQMIEMLDDIPSWTPA